MVFRHWEGSDIGDEPKPDLSSDKTVRVSHSTHRLLQQVTAYMEQMALEDKRWAADCQPPCTYDTVIRYLVSCHLRIEAQRRRKR